jgi:hypothetical protein
MTLTSSLVHGQSISWSVQPVQLENESSSWARMVHLQDDSWLSAYTVGSSPTHLRVKRSFDRMRSWQFIAELGEPGRDLDNANLLQVADGAILLAIRSIVTGVSYRIQIYRSIDNGNSFQSLSTADSSENTGGSRTRGVYEPFLQGLADGFIACYYANEKHSIEKPAYSQVISERISKDGGQTWGQEIRAVALAGVARPGEPNVIALNGGSALFYEVCGSELCVGHTSLSPDGFAWSGGIGPPIPGTWQDAQAVVISGTVVATSNLHSILISSGDLSEWQDTGMRPFVYGSWPALYQTAIDEIALVMTGGGDAGEPGQYIRFGRFRAASHPALPR